MSNFVKLYGSILDSTIWQESLATKVVWITLLAMADATGAVDASVPGLVRRAGVTRAECEAALERLMAPDPDSKTTTHEGRRIEKVDRGWRLLNYLAYREKRSEGHLGDAGSCYVYYAVDGERVKIGSSKNPWARVATLRRELKRPGIAIRAVERGGYDLEHNRHRDFADTRLDGEWFQLSPQLEAHMASLPHRNPGSKAEHKPTTVATQVAKRSSPSLTVATKEGEEEEEKTTTPPTAAIAFAFMGEIKPVWRTAYGGDVPPGTAKQLKPLVEAHGSAEVASRLANYLASTDAQYASIRRFASTYGTWGEKRNGDQKGAQIRKGYA